MSSGKSYSLVGVQDTDKAIRHADCQRTRENGCPHLQTGNRKGIQYCRWEQPISCPHPLCSGCFYESLQLIIPKISSPSANILNLPRNTFALAKGGTEVACMCESVSRTHRFCPLSPDV